MEDRIGESPAGRPGPALAALLSILAITAAWWALALWPAGPGEPEWLVRTRAACFGSMRGGLPDAGGWILLIGEPIGMLGALVTGWGRSVKRDLVFVLARPPWRQGAATVAALLVVGMLAAGARVLRVSARGPSPGATTSGVLDMDAPSVALTDQHGRRASFADLRGHAVLLTFAFGHCATTCPAVVHDLRAARRSANRADVPLVIITLDPWRDTPDRLLTMATAWDLAAGDRVWSGSVAEVEHALDVLGIGRRRDENTGDIMHSATVMVVNDRGRIVWRTDGGWVGVEQVLRRL